MFEALAQHSLPGIYSRMKDLGMEIGFRLPAWFMPLFFTILEPNVVVRIWDLFFFTCKVSDGQ